ncbi:hypothetical protein K227x_51800 [Rubripirellula lacrimiformis]|uniref:Type II secretion system protein H n=2 Tax=Rubripirellula lacrimiformis TaxID=1930273 RepID=A0A517NI07_9BACT|nr:hypothetical protein K227x_51800 [Rubripirellula lacrimiformis]
MIELTITVLIVGLIAAVATPQFAASTCVANLQSAAYHVAADVEHIRRSAIVTGRPTSIDFDNSTAQYESVTVFSTQRKGTLVDVELRQLSDSSTQMIADFDGESSLSFDTEGVPRAGSAAMTSGSIDLRCGGFRYVVTIAKGTGAVSVASAAMPLE